MKIVNRKQFLAMPAGTLFSKYEPCVFGPLHIKGETCGNCNDFLEQQIADAIDCDDFGDFVGKLELAQATGASVAMDFDCQGRDGCFDDSQLFAVWESNDVNALIRRLERALGDAA